MVWKKLILKVLSENIHLRRSWPKWDYSKNEMPQSGRNGWAIELMSLWPTPTLGQRSRCLCRYHCVWRRGTTRGHHRHFNDKTYHQSKSMFVNGNWLDVDWIEMWNCLRTNHQTSKNEFLLSLFSPVEVRARQPTPQLDSTVSRRKGVGNTTFGPLGPWSASMQMFLPVYQMSPTRAVHQSLDTPHYLGPFWW